MVTDKIQLSYRNCFVFCQVLQSYTQPVLALSISYIVIFLILLPSLVCIVYDHSLSVCPLFFDLEKTSSNDSCNCRIEWYIVVVTLVSGIIVGILFTNIVSCTRRQFRRTKPQPNPELQTEVDTTYQELDLAKMNAEDNYQSLRVNSASNEASNNDDSNYAELSQIRDVENNYQSLTPT